MILITLGTQDKSFVRLLKKIDELIDKNVIDEKVVVQAGFTKYESKNMKIFDLIPRDEFDELIKNSKYIITHAGVGTILTAINNDKKVIGVARLKKYKEHTNDHQVELVKYFSKAGYILGAKNVDDLENQIKKIDKFKPKKYKGDTKGFIKTLQKDINKYGSRQKYIIMRISLFFIVVVGILYLLFF